VADAGQTEFQLVIDVRRFRIAVDAKPSAEIGLSARIVDKNGKVVAARLFEESEKFDQVAPPEQLMAVRRLVGTRSQDIESAIEPGGHLSLFVGGETLGGAWARAGRWLSAPPAMASIAA